MENYSRDSDKKILTSESNADSERSNNREILQLVRSLPVKSQAEILQLINDLRLVADCSVPIGVTDQNDLLNELRRHGFAVVPHREINGRMSYFVSKEKKFADEALEVENTDVKRYGELMGFPATAIDAFVAGKDKLMNSEEVKQILGFENIFFSMRLSKEHYKADVEYLKKCYRLLLEKAPYLISDLIHKDDADKYVEAVTKFVNN